MTKDPCLVCQGRRTIILPLLHPVSIVYGDSPTKDQKESSRQYPCPECAPPTSDTRVMLLGAERRIDMQMYELKDYYPEKIFHEGIADQMARKLLDDNYIKFEKFQIDPGTMAIRGTLGVMAPAVVATMEERIREHQTKIAHDVIIQFCKMLDENSSFLEVGKEWAKNLAAKALRQVNYSLMPVGEKRND